MSSKHYSSDLHMSIGQAPIPQSTSYGTSNSMSYAPWTTDCQYHLPLGSTATTGYESTFSYASTDHDDPSMFGSSTASGMNWPNYQPLIPATAGWTPSVNPSTASVYSGVTVPIPSGSYPSTSIWGSGDHQASISLYSDDRPPLTRSISADQGASAGFALPISRISGSSAPTSPMTYQTLDTMPSPSIPPSSSISKSRGASRSASKRPETKLRSTASGISRRKSSSPVMMPSGASAIAASAASAEKQYQSQLMSRFGPAMSAMSPGQDARFTTEQIRREAWRICKAEALEMSQRRIKLLEHEHGALERETQQLQVNIGLMREAVVREQAELEKAVGRAERLSSSY